MSWIESHQSLSHHRKTMKAARLLKCDRHKLIGHLHTMWWWGLDNAAEDGSLPGIERSDLAVAAEWRGDPEAFAVVLIDAGFIDSDPRGTHLRLHDWWEYAGKLTSQRDLRKDSNRERQRLHRERNALRNASVTRDTTVTECDENSAVTSLPYPTVPNRTQPTNVDSPPTPSDDDGVCVSGLDLGVFGGDDRAVPKVPVLAAAVPKTEAEASYADFEAKFRDGNGGHYGDKAEAGRAWFDYVTKPGHDPAIVLAALAGYFASSDYADQRSRNLARIGAAKWLAQWTDWLPKATKPKTPTVITWQGREIPVEAAS